MDDRWRTRWRARESETRFRDRAGRVDQIQGSSRRAGRGSGIQLQWSPSENSIADWEQWKDGCWTSGAATTIWILQEWMGIFSTPSRRSRQWFGNKQSGMVGTPEKLRWCKNTDSVSQRTEWELAKTSGREQTQRRRSCAGSDCHRSIWMAKEIRRFRG